VITAVSRRGVSGAADTSSRLPGGRLADSVRAVTFRWLLPLCATALLVTGCASSYTENVFTRNRPYRKVRVTDLQGFLIADWVAEGHVWSHSPGYRFTAVERRTGGPYPVLSKYPQGRKVVVTGPNIVVMPCGKPQWLYELEGF
jgi:hypothetical protein